MPAFSFTAPFISEKQEREERAALPETEKKRLDEDIYGRGRIGEANHDETEEEAFLLRGVEDLRLELERLPVESTSAYNEAVVRCPELVKKESDFVPFFRGAKYDAAEAAKKLADYWTVRKSVFGEEGAFLPMMQHQKQNQQRQALREDDAKKLSMGLLHMLPEDEHGRSIMFWDRIRCVRSVITYNEMARILFYFLQVLSERQGAQVRGYVLLINLKGLDLYRHFDRMLAKVIFKVAQAFPASLRCIHGISGAGQSVMKLALPVIKHIAGLYVRLRFVTHSGSDKEVMTQLEQYGISSSERLTSLMSGCRTANNDVVLNSWIVQRQRREEERDHRRRRCHPSHAITSNAADADATVVDNHDGQGVIDRSA